MAKRDDITGRRRSARKIERQTPFARRFLKHLFGSEHPLELSFADFGGPRNFFRTPAKIVVIGGAFGCQRVRGDRPDVSLDPDDLGLLALIGPGKLGLLSLFCLPKGGVIAAVDGDRAGLRIEFEDPIDRLIEKRTVVRHDDRRALIA